MVSEKTEENVTGRFPSLDSLKRFFIMGTVLAEKVLGRLIPQVKDSIGSWLKPVGRSDGFDERDGFASFDDDVIEEEEEDYKTLKRKRYSFGNLGLKNTKKARVEIIGKQTQQDEPIQRDPKKRWSAERYELAKKNLLVVMKQKGATTESPVLRSELRVEARKLIRDTGLLDYLLKHMPGNIAPGGQERFRRRHNPDGAMEYWLESADLVNKAGVSDPFWVPPPDWKPGNSPIQDPICARELLRTSTAVLGCSEFSQKLDLLVSSLDKHVSLEKYKLQLMTASNVVKEIEEMYKGQLMAVSNIVKEIEEEMEKSLHQNK